MIPGTRLGPYEIVSRIGAGGMGEVFKARDTRLDRSVAVKVLPAELARDAQFRLRFEREAKAISQLSHPHICTLFDVGDDYLVMELLEGESLADVVAKGPLPLPDVFRLGIQIAEALDRAHRAGIVHRDLKPGNVMITRSGAKLLDFGLAKYADVAGQHSSPALATEQKPLTQEGSLLGTFQYMAPEQLDGAEADARTDIFALGAVLYEMATGTRAFGGKTKTSLIAAIVKDSPRPISELRPLTPPALEHVIAQCLEKDPERRWQSAHDVAEELRWISGTSQSSAGIATSSSHRRSRPLTIAILALPWILAAALAVWHFRPIQRPATFSSILPPPGMSFSFEAGQPALSPNGRRLAFIASNAAGNSQLYVRDLAKEIAQPLAGTEGAQRPFWSADGTMLAFFSGAKLKTIPAAGGPTQIIADAPNGRGGTWGPDGTIVYNADFRDGLLVLPPGGAPRRLTKIAPGEISHRWPVFLPDGKSVLFLAQRAEGGAEGDTSSIDLVTLADGKRRQIVQANSSPIYSPSKHLLYWRDKTLFCQPFDPGNGKLTGTAVSLATDVTYTGTEAAVAAVSMDGTLTYQAHGTLDQSTVMTADRQGVNANLRLPTAPYGDLSLSRDGRKLAFSVLDRGEDLRVFDIVRGTITRLTFYAEDERAPVWSPDDRKIAFSVNKKDGGDIYVVDASGGTAEMLWEQPGEAMPTDWSRDGQSLLCDVATPSTASDIWIYSFSERRAVPWLQTPFNEGQAVFSPDGRWIAYTSDESGHAEVYVQSRDRKEKWQISRDGGSTPRWRGDGRELVYLAREDAATQAAGAAPSDGSASVHSVDVSTADFDGAKPTRLFTFRTSAMARTGTIADLAFAVSPDGKTFYLETPASNTDSPLTLVQHWTALLP